MDGKDASIENRAQRHSGDGAEDRLFRVDIARRKLRSVGIQIGGVARQLF
jgi:hypothetical protein